MIHLLNSNIENVDECRKWLEWILVIFKWSDSKNKNIKTKMSKNVYFQSWCDTNIKLLFTCDFYKTKYCYWFDVSKSPIDVIKL